MNKSVRLRRYDIDWLRVLAMLMIFLFHTARTFDNMDWHIKNKQLDFGMTIFVNIVAQWIMPLFFMLSAMSAHHALRHRKDKEYISERFKRLAIPFVFGMFVLIPPQVYVERVNHSQFVGSFIEFLPHYFEGLYGFGGNFAWMGLHLWYLGVLFIFTVLALPFIRYIQTEAPQNFIGSVAGFLKRPGAIFLSAIPIAVMEMVVNLQPAGIGRRDFGGWSILTYLVFFILGYLMASDSQFKESIERHRVIALIASIITTILSYLWLTSGMSDRHYLLALMRGLMSWSWLLAILGFGSRYLVSTNGLLKYANEAVLPFYILHQTVIVLIGFYVTRWDTSVIVKYLAISSTSFVIIVGLYELLVKRDKALRFLFGMKPGLRVQ
jgi:peptidoglycan/LPS O-acetylase OafA/YrhL